MVSILEIYYFSKTSLHEPFHFLLQSWQFFLQAICTTDGLRHSFITLLSCRKCFLLWSSCDSFLDHSSLLPTFCSSNLKVEHVGGKFSEPVLSKMFFLIQLSNFIDNLAGCRILRYFPSEILRHSIHYFFLWLRRKLIQSDTHSFVKGQAFPIHYITFPGG